MVHVIAVAGGQGDVGRTVVEVLGQNALNQVLVLSRLLESKFVLSIRARAEITSYFSPQPAPLPMAYIRQERRFAKMNTHFKLLPEMIGSL
jgi:hypothetical protein